MLWAFLDANPGVIEAKPRAGLHETIGQHGRHWLDAAREVSSDYYDDGEADLAAQMEADHPSGTTRECDFCGAEVTMGQFPTHLAEECEETSS